MSYIFGAKLHSQKNVVIALMQIFGIGPNKSFQICSRLGISKSVKIGQLNKNQIDQIVKIITQNYFVDLELKRIIKRDVQNCIMIASYRGFRHNDGLPLRGQRTHTNARTSRKRKILHILRQTT